VHHQGVAEISYYNVGTFTTDRQTNVAQNSGSFVGLALFAAYRGVWWWQAHNLFQRIPLDLPAARRRNEQVVSENNFSNET
jgi:hypothetical protein